MLDLFFRTKENSCSSNLVLLFKWKQKDCQPQTFIEHKNLNYWKPMYQFGSFVLQLDKRFQSRIMIYYVYCTYLFQIGFE